MNLPDRIILQRLSIAFIIAGGILLIAAGILACFMSASDDITVYAVMSGTAGVGSIAYAGWLKYCINNKS